MSPPVPLGINLEAMCVCVQTDQITDGEKDKDGRLKI